MLIVVDLVTSSVVLKHAISSIHQLWIGSTNILEENSLRFRWQY